MKLTKYFLTAALLLTLSLNIAKADDNKNISKESDLAFQMKNEIKSMLLLPWYTISKYKRWLLMVRRCKWARKTIV